jgi:hypothetical protein
MNYIKIETTLSFTSLLSSSLISPPYLSLLYIKTVNRPFKRARRTSTLNLRLYIISSKLIFISFFLNSSSASTLTFINNNNLSEETVTGNKKRRR